MEQENEEFTQGFITAFRAKKPEPTGHDYLQGYAQGYNAYLSRNQLKIIGKTCFILGYQDCTAKKQPALNLPDYIEGYALAHSTNKKPKQTLDQYFYLERDVLLAKFTRTY